MDSRTLNRRNVLHTLGAGALVSALLASANSVEAADKEKHPHVREAIRALKDAKKELKEREKIFGGHAQKALDAVTSAIDELEKALDYAEKN